MSLPPPTALIADDEPLLREALQRQLAEAWPELRIVAQARNGREAVEMFEALQPRICFLDVHMPGLSGVEAGRKIGSRAHLVFVTAFDHYAIQAFDQGAIDYLVKPVERERLADTVSRLKERLTPPPPGVELEALLRDLAARLPQSPTSAPSLRWVRAQIGQTLRLIAVGDVDFFQSDSKYTLIAWRGDGGQPAEALVRMPLKELAALLDPGEFAQIHRGCIVNLRSVNHLTRGDNDTATLHLKGREERLPVSRSYLAQFRQM